MKAIAAAHARIRNAVIVDPKKSSILEFQQRLVTGAFAVPGVVRSGRTAADWWALAQMDPHDFDAPQTTTD